MGKVTGNVTGKGFFKPRNWQGVKRMKIGSWCEVDSLETLEKSVFSLKNQGVDILNFSEFKHLLKTQVLTHIPHDLSVETRLHDRILNASAFDIAKETELPPHEYKRLRMAFLLKKQNDKYKKRVLHETQILNHLRAKEAVSLLDFQNYLSSFFKPSFESFFSQRAFNLHIDQLKAHSYITAGSRHGKSELVKRLVYGVMESGQSAIVLDPHGDLATQIAQWKEFSEHPEKLVYFNAYAFGDSLHSIPVLNPLAPLKNALERDSVVSGFIDTLTSVIDDKDAPSDRMKSILKACLYTFASYGQEVDLYDLLDFLGMGERAEYWKNQAKKLLTNQSLLAMVEDFDKKEYANTKTAIRDRLRVLLASDALDSCLVGKNTINLADAMDSGKIIVFDLSKGRLGRDSSNAFGRLLLSAISGNAMQRQTTNKHHRKPVFLFMDEGDNYMSPSVIEIYKETGKYGLFITFIQQVAGYGMSAEEWRVLKTNSLLRFGGNVGGDGDGAKIVSEILDTPKEDILNLPKGNFWLKYGTGTPQKIRIGLELIDDRNAMTSEQWQRVKEYQKAHYYRAKIAREAHKNDNQEQEKPQPNKPKEPKQPPKDGKKSPLDFDLD